MENMKIVISHTVRAKIGYEKMAKIVVIQQTLAIYAAVRASQSQTNAMYMFCNS